jgi:hypothetical protein
MNDKTKTVVMAFTQSPIYDKAIDYAIRMCNADDIAERISRRDAEQRGIHIPTIYTFLPPETSCIVSTQYDKITYSNLWGRLANCISDYYAGFKEGIEFMKPSK